MSKQVVITSGNNGPALSNAQQTFQEQMAAIRRLKAEIAAIKAELPVFRAQADALLRPCLEDVRLAQREMLNALHTSPAHKKLTRNQQQALATVMMHWSEHLMHSDDDQEMLILFHAYADQTLSEFRNRNQHFHETAQAELPTTWNEKPDYQENTPLTGKKAARQAEKKRKLAEAEKHLNQTTKKVWFDLVRHFHPDQEQDPEIRTQKDRIMQEINAAYSAGDFLQLLELQLTLLSDKALSSGLASGSDLKYSNILLKQQVATLEAEKRALLPDPEGAFWARCYIPGDITLSIRNLRKQATQLTAAAKGYRQLLPDIETPSGLKGCIAWLAGEEED